MSLLRVFFEVGKLKKVKRQGWVRSGVKRPESVAEHSYRLAFMCMVIPLKSHINRVKLIKMALLHDFSEAQTGDIVYERGVKVIADRAKKINKEEKAITKQLNNIENRNELFQIWKEYVSLKTNEAKLLKEMDKLEMALQAYEYKKEAPEEVLDEFWQNAAKWIKEKEVKKIFAELLKLKSKN